MTDVRSRTDHDHRPEAIRERLAIEPAVSYLRDWVYGGIDGSVTTFAIVSGVAGASLSPAIVMILGVANLLADGFSMAAGNYSATRTERQELDAVRAVEDRHITMYPEGELEEVRQICINKGFVGVELERMVAMITGDRERWIDFMVAEEYGLAQQIRSAKKAAWTTFVSFVVCGVVPLLPFLLRLPNAFAISLAVTLMVFFAIGSLKSRVVAISWWRAGLETLAIGSAAAAIAYLIGLFLKPFTA